MAKPLLPAALLAKLTPLVDTLLAKLPFLPKRPVQASRGDEPFEHLEDASLESDESFEPNAITAAGTKPDRRTAIDFGALLHAFLGNHLALGLVGASLLVVLGIAVASIVEQSEPRAGGAVAKPITEEGRQAVSRLILPPDPAFGLDPPMERARHFPYTDEDMKLLAPVHDPGNLATLVKKNDRAIEALFQGVR